MIFTYKNLFNLFKQNLYFQFEWNKEGINQTPKAEESLKTLEYNVAKWKKPWAYIEENWRMLIVWEEPLEWLIQITITKPIEEIAKEYWLTVWQLLGFEWNRELLISGKYTIIKELKWNNSKRSIPRNAIITVPAYKKQKWTK